MKYDQLLHLHESLAQRMEGTHFITFIAPQGKSEYDKFMSKIASVADLKGTNENEILKNPETVRNQLDQVPDCDLEIYVRSTDPEDEFTGSVDEYRTKYNIGTMEVAGYSANSDQ